MRLLLSQSLDQSLIANEAIENCKNCKQKGIALKFVLIMIMRTQFSLEKVVRKKLKVLDTSGKRGFGVAFTTRIIHVDTRIWSC